MSTDVASAPANSVRLGGVVLVAFAAMPRIAAAQAATCNSPPSAVVAALEQRYRAVRTFNGDFVQTYLARSYNRSTTSKGHVVFSRPANVDWTFTDPAGTRVVSDGITITTYDAPNARAFVQNVSQAQSPYLVALTFLDPLSKTHTAFQVLCGTTMQFPSGIVLVAVPITASPVYTKILFYMDAGSEDVRRVLLLDGQGNRNRFDFNATKLDQPVGRHQFVFTAPPGVSVILPPPSAPPPPAPALQDADR